MVVQRSSLPWRLLLAAVLLIAVSVLPAAVRGAPVAAAIPTEQAHLREANAPPRSPPDTQPDALAETTLEVKIAAGSDDAGTDYDCDYATTHNEIYIGLCRDGRDITSGLRFADVRDARIRFTVDGPFTDDITLNFYGEAAGNIATFSDSNRPENRPLIAGQMSEWPITSSDPWEIGEVRYTPPLTNILQEIVKRADWSPGNALAIIVKNSGPASGYWRARRVIAYERPTWYPGTEYAAALVVTYKKPTDSTLTAPRAGTRPIIDGNLTEWAGLTQTRLNKDTASSITGQIPTPADLSAGLRTAWAPEALYFAAAISDDVLVGNNGPVEKLWGDDVIELGIRVGSTTHQFILAVVCHTLWRRQP